MSNLAAGKYLKYFNPLSAFNTKRTRDIFHVNPTVPPVRQEAEAIQVMIYDYNGDHFHEQQTDSVA
ncbi:MAG TPA: hypothetical protein DIW54_02855, partial [Chitinophagaceae bacterium]|nr:hypothetical protein [Chitinophagaceae bacterium]